MIKGCIRKARIVAISAALTFVPFASNAGDGFYPQAEAASANAGGKGKGGENKGGNSGANNLSGGIGNGGLNKAGGGIGNANSSAATSASNISPSDMGRLNAFLNASSTALQDAAPNSAIGIVATQYAGSLSAYTDANALAIQGQGPAPTLDDAAALLAKAANKPVSPEIVAAINERLAAENPDNLNLAGFANPTNDPAVGDTNTQLATSIADLINTLPDTKTNQGLGPSN
jgi:hypothetical protein